MTTTTMSAEERAKRALLGGSKGGGNIERHVEDAIRAAESAARDRALEEAAVFFENAQHLTCLPNREVVDLLRRLKERTP